MKKSELIKILESYPDDIDIQIDSVKLNKPCDIRGVFIYRNGSLIIEI